MHIIIRCESADHFSYYQCSHKGHPSTRTLTDPARAIKTSPPAPPRNRCCGVLLLWGTLERGVEGCPETLERAEGSFVAGVRRNRPLFFARVDSRSVSASRHHGARQRAQRHFEGTLGPLRARLHGFFSGAGNFAAMSCSLNTIMVLGLFVGPRT